jgi:3-methyladenine DNA glycosylase AlkD
LRNPTRPRISAALRRMARPSGSFEAARYFRGDHGLRFHNVGTPKVRALAREIYAANPAWTMADAMRLAGELMPDPYLETKAIGIEIVARYRRAFTPRLLPAWKAWLARDLSANWATTDLICGMLIGPLVADHPQLIPRLRTWVRHRKLWVRRASAVALIPAIRRGLASDAPYHVADALQPDGEDLIQKAVGWMLREAGRRDPRRLERYLRSTGGRVPRTTLRYAIERFPAATRRDLLASTRPLPRAKRR